MPGLSAFAAAVACTAGPWSCVTVGKFMLGLNASITAANGGTIGQILTDFAVGAVAYGIPGLDALGDGLAGALNEAVKNEIASVMLMGGIVSKAQGGKFIDGFKGAAIGAAAGALGKSASFAKDSGSASTILGDFVHELRAMSGVKEPEGSGMQYTEVEKVGSGTPFPSEALMIDAPDRTYRASPLDVDTGMLVVGGSDYGAVGLKRGETVSTGAVYSIGTAIGVFAVGAGVPTAWMTYRALPIVQQRSLFHNFERAMRTITDNTVEGARLVKPDRFMHLKDWGGQTNHLTRGNLNE